MSRKPKLTWTVDTNWVNGPCARHIAALNTVVDVIDRGDGWGVELFVMGQFIGRRRLSCDRRRKTPPLVRAEEKLLELLADAQIRLRDHDVKLKELCHVLCTDAG